MRPLVSVVVPMYNCATYLRKCLDCLINQTLKEIEIICVNDGSPDNSLDIAKEYQNKDKRIIIITQKNKGLSEARNVGMKKVTSSYVMFCDSDDFYDLDMCEKMYYSISENNVDLVCCGIKPIYEGDVSLKESDEKYYKIKFLGKQKVSSEHFFNTDVSVCNKIFKIDLIKKHHVFFPKGLFYEDAPFFFKYMSVAKSVFFRNEYLYNYIRHSGSIMDATKKKTLKAVDHIKVMEDVYLFLVKKRLLSKWKKEFLDLYINYFLFSERNIPKDQKNKCYEAAWPIMKKFSAQDVSPLSFWRKELWCHILQLCYNHRKSFFNLKK